MSADPFKLEVWVRSQCARGADAFALALVARLDQGDQLSPVDDWPAPAPTEAEAFVALVQEQATADAAAFPGRVCNYLLTAQKAGRPTNSRRFTARGQEGATFGGMSEPPTSHGVTAMLMRHLEAERRLSIESKISALDDMKRVLDVSIEMLKTSQTDAAALRARELETVNLYARLQAGSQGFELEKAKLTAEQASSAEARQRFWGIATPVLLAKLGAAPLLPPGPPGPSDAPPSMGDASPAPAGHASPGTPSDIDPTALDLFGALAQAQVPLDALVSTCPPEVQRAVHSYVQKYGPALRARLQSQPQPQPEPNQEQAPCTSPPASPPPV